MTGGHLAQMISDHQSSCLKLETPNVIHSIKCHIIRGPGKTWRILPTNNIMQTEVLHIPSEKLVPSMEPSFNAPDPKGWTQSDIDELEHYHKFGKGYSSDNSGDGPKNKKERQLKNSKKRVSRTLAQSLASTVIGEDAAKLGYKMLAKAVKSVKTKKSNKSSRGMLSLSLESSRYLKSFINPFSQEVRSAHIPSLPSYPSQKAYGFVRGTGFIGTAGVGFVCMNPSVTNTYPSVYSSTAAYANTTMACPSNDNPYNTASANNPFGQAFSNLPYDDVALGSTTPGAEVEGRIVSASLRLMYTGTELNRSGVIYAYSDSDGDTVAGGARNSGTVGNGYSPSTMSTKEGCEITGVNKKYTQVVLVPPNNGCFNYPDRGNNRYYPYNTGNTVAAQNLAGVAINVASPSCGIMITGVAGQSFYYEAIVHVEYIGSGVTQSLMSQSSSDVVGLDAVTNVIARAQREAASDPQADFQRCVRKVMHQERIKYGTSKRSREN